MTVGEILRVINIYNKRLSDNRREKAIYDYTLANLFRFTFSDAEMPPIEELYPGVFETDVQSETDKKLAKFKAQLQAFSIQHNAKLEKKGTD